MGIEEKHAYRFGFLKSDKWQDIRLWALAKKDAKCRMCNARSLSNDVHHVIYRESFWDTKKCDVVVLCRRCHDLVHGLMDIWKKHKTQDEWLCNWKLFRIIEASIKFWLSEVRLGDKTKAPGPTTNIKDDSSCKPRTHCMGCKSASNVFWVQILPYNPKPHSVWLLCGACEEAFVSNNVSSFADARKLLVDLKSVVSNL